jgi:ribonuclease P protein component
MKLLFEKGKSLVVFPIKLTFCFTPVNLKFPAQAMFVVPKRSFKKAHDRNKLKRRMREAYRLNKKTSYNDLVPFQTKMILAFLYVGKKSEDFTSIESCMQKLMKNCLSENKTS